MGRATRAIIDLSAIRQNYRLAKSLAPGANALAVIKADAYGHGAVRVALALEADAIAFGVACIEEAIELRDAGVKKPILLLEGFFTPDELSVIADNNFWTAIHRIEQIAMLENAQLSAPVNVWLKLDSGMHRLGFDSCEYRQAFERLNACNQVSEIVLMSHLSCADELDKPHTQQQTELFDQTVEGIPALHSFANSPAVLAWPALHRGWIRPGLMLYGASPFEMDQPNADQLVASMTLQSEVIAIHDLEAGEAVGYAASYVCDKKTRVGTVAIGYGDGYTRHAGTGTPVLVNGQRAQIIGRVSMDMCAVDLTGLSDVAIGATVELWGSQLSINEVARHCGTIPYSLFTGVTKRVPRQYI
ncbi:alanine racemase [Neptunomonas antarctica]|uniref:Alanine racemase n=1 Tax=Neptunomonas antarctica TaxID=619304 RepID=A0A1N7K6E9_9GAMM|nr:alanine racemase [Neptunomonas antarctica]SIS57149.1 alanine racemase [Neptunomonas antarctica]